MQPLETPRSMARRRSPHRAQAPRRRPTHRWARHLAPIIVIGLVAAACGDDEDDTTTTTAPTTPTDGTTPTDDVTGLAFTLFGAPTGVEGQAMQGFLDVYNDRRGSNVVYEGSDSFEEQLRIRVEGGNAPMAAVTPQPGSICDFAEDGELMSLEDMGFDISEMEADHGTFWMDLGKCDDGMHYGIPWFPNYKSIIWYRTAVFDERGYDIPESYDDLVDLTAQMVEDGQTPWCFGFGSDATSGWPGTDWIEDILVRQEGSEFYGEWYSHEVPFDSPEVIDAFDRLADIFFAEEAVLGGTDNVAAIDFREAPLPMFDDPPGCALHKQGSFIANFFPEGGEDLVGFFPFPTIDGKGGAMGGGDTLMVFESDPRLVAAIRDWISPDWQCVLASPTGGTASAYGGHGVAGVERLPGHKDVPLDCYETETARVQAEAVRSALADDTFVFDASDLMPPAVGQGSFWTAMLDWSRGTSAEDVVADVEESWPTP